MAHSSFTGGIAVAPSPGVVESAPSRPLAPPVRPEHWLADCNNPARRFALKFAFVFFFFRFTLLHEVLGVMFGTNFYILYITGALATVGLLLSGGLHRVFRWKVSYYWLLYLAFLLPASIFSLWRGHSLSIVLPYIRTDMILLLLIGGLIMTWKEFWALLQMLAVAAVVDIWVAHKFAGFTADRFLLSMQGGSISDPNDFAAHLLLLLPFLLLVFLTPGRIIWVRALAAVGMLAGLYVVLNTGSRGGLLALSVISLYILFRLPTRYRLLAGMFMGLAGVVFALTLPRTVLLRLGTTFSTRGDATTDEDYDVELGAAGSAEGRKFLLKQALLITLKHPLLGVGPGEFQDAEGALARAAGLRGAWHETHNTYLQVSSEVGIPAFLCFMAALISTYRLFRRVDKEAQKRPPTAINRRIALAAFCLRISMLVFCAAIFFLSFAYRFYLPALTGVAMAFAQVIDFEWRSQEAAAAKP